MVKQIKKERSEDDETKDGTRRIKEVMSKIKKRKGMEGTKSLSLYWTKATGIEVGAKGKPIKQSEGGIKGRAGGGHHVREKATGPTAKEA